ncbi:DNA-directed RNA polymerase subunit beta [Tepidiforma sp.]|uniref:DNA-directed RNA polymerase subunit beta n=1 Tax=Tepidiforma sp. TaxID=2682230 RepID=UPI003A10190B
MTTARDVVPGGIIAPTAVKAYGRIPDVLDLPNLIRIQLDSFEWFKREGLRELFDELSPIQDFTGKKMDLIFGEYEFREPKASMDECRERDMTYAAPLFVDVELRVKESGEIKEQRLFFGDFPLMTDRGTFIINGAERVVVSQLVRSPGVYYTIETDQTTGKRLCHAKLIPNRGAWLEFETSNRDVLYVKVDRKRKVPVTTFLRAIDVPGLVPGDRDNPRFEKYWKAVDAGDDAAREAALKELEAELGTDERILALFEAVDTSDLRTFTINTINKETRDPGVTNKHEALLDFYRKIRPGDPPTADNARNLLKTLFFDPRRYDLGRVGRHKVNKRLELEDPTDQRWLRPYDLVAIVREQININNGRGHHDDIDHLGNRRVRAVGELIQQQFRVGLLRMERVVRERMTITDPEEATPSALINIRPVVASMKEFFGGSQLSQFMDQTNPLSELNHKRRLSALGPGGLSRDRAGFDVRDVHHSHYGRICPIETPEGPNIGLIGSLATYARLNNFGFIETPYRRVYREMLSDNPNLIGRILREDALDADGNVIAPAGTTIDEAIARRIGESGRSVAIEPWVSSEIVYLTADEEDRYKVGQANTRIDENGHFIDERVEVRLFEKFMTVPPVEVDCIDVSPKQMVSVASALIPFLEHDDANRALMGANMQRQAVPLVRPEVPLVGTGMERRAAVDSGHVITAEGPGEVLEATGTHITIRYDDPVYNLDPGGQTRTYRLVKFTRSNQGTCLNQRPIVFRGQRVQAGQPIIDSSSTQGGDLALGQNILCAFMSWEGYNFEDAIILSENLVREDKFTSIHIEKHEIEARQTKLGDEEITRDIPNVGEEALSQLDEDGIIRIGAEVREGDILVGKITPKGETELTAEEKLLRAIFGEKAREVKDTSLRVPHGERGKVIDVKVFDRSNHDGLPAGVNKLVRVSIAQRRKISEGDKMAGRHGNKGVISRILPREDMPYLEDGTPVDIILNPIGVPSRMNIGQVLETHLGWAANTLGFRAISPVFDGARDYEIDDALALAWMAHESGAVHYVDPRDRRFDEERLKVWIAEQGYDPDAIYTNPEDGAPARACLEIWLNQHRSETGQPPIERGRHTREELEELAREVYKQTNVPPPIYGKMKLIDGRTGEPFDQPVTVGYIYMLKLIHLVEDKIHARSTGPYSLITQQPLGGKAQFGGQRFGEMEVWALEAYGAAHILQELLTVKSDDVVGRVKTYEAIVKGEDVLEPGVPESFKVLVKELQSLGLAVEVSNDEGSSVSFIDDSANDLPELGLNLTGFEREEELFNARGQ